MRRKPVKRSEVFTVNLQRQRGSNAGNEFLDPHLDRLRRTEHDRRNRLLQRFLHLLGQLGQADPLRPLILGFGVDQHFHVIRIGRIAQFRTADGGQCRPDLWELFLEYRVEPPRNSNRLFK